MDGHEVIGPDAVVGVTLWLALALSLNWVVGKIGRRTAVGIWGTLNVGGLLWLLSFQPPWSVVSGVMIVTGFSWVAGRVVIEQP